MIMLNVIILSVSYAVNHYAKCRCAECHYAECCGTAYYAITLITTVKVFITMGRGFLPLSLK
jgi:hypothetical protein